MNDPHSSVGPAFDTPPDAADPSTSRWGTTLAGALLVVIGAGMLAERTGLLSLQWRAAIWPVLLMVFGAASLLRPNPDGRHGLFFIVAGAWWYAGLAGWISMLQTWPLLIVGLGISAVLQAVTASPGLPRGGWPRHRHRESGLMPLVLVAILVGAILANRDRLASFTTGSDGGVRIVSILGEARHQLTGETVPGGTVVTVMGRSTLDLSRAPVSPGAPLVLDGVTVMGRSVFYVPPGWAVDLNSLSVFGSVRDRRSAPASGPPQLQLRGAVVFGSIEIRSADEISSERRP